MADSSHRAGDLRPDEPAAWRGLTGALLKYLEARGVLAQIELQEALAQIIQAAAFGVISMILAVGAWLLMVPASVWFISQRMGWPWHEAFVIAGAVHALLALFILWKMVTKVRRVRWFKETLDQFGKDRSWIAQQTGKP